MQRIKKDILSPWRESMSFWRRGWDSNPRYLAVQLISSQSRYDHFDTSPYGAATAVAAEALIYYINCATKGQELSAFFPSPRAAY